MRAGFKIIEVYLWEGCECVHVANYEFLNEIGFYSFNLDSTKYDWMVGRWQPKGTKKSIT